MARKLSPFLEANYGWDFGESGWNTGMDENLIKFSYLFQSTVDGIVSSLPSATEGTSYYNTSDNRIYYVVGGAYYSTPVPKWFQFKLKTNGEPYVFDGSGYVAAPLSSVIKNSLNQKAPLDSPIFTGVVSGITKTMVGLSNVDNTSDQNKPVSTLQKASIDTKANKGDNSDITSLSGLTTPLSANQGGTGSSSLSGLLTNLNALGNYSRTNILATVTQSGGVPTGGIISTGTGANGRWTMFADGTLICEFTNTVTIANATAAQYTWTFPATFSAPPVVLTGVSSTYPYLVTSGCEPNITTTACMPTYYNNYSQSLSITRILFAKGRWY